MLKSENYINLINDLNEKIFEGTNDYPTSFVFSTDGFEYMIEYKGFKVFYSGDFPWVYDDEPEFIPYKDQVINEIKNELRKIIKEIEGVLN